METSQQSYKRTLAGSVGAGMGAIFNGSGRTYYIIEHKTNTGMHHAGDSQKIIIDQIELGRDGSCQVRFDESCETVSRKHAAIVKEGDRYKLIPLSQTNGTYVNNQLVQAPCFLNSGDEIKLSSNGPVMGFIVPQGAKSLVSSIGLTERMNLFRQQALRPYKMALTILSIVLVLSVGGLIAWNVYQSKVFEEQRTEMLGQISQTEEQLRNTQDEVAQTTFALESAKDEVNRLRQDQSATQEQIARANANLESAQKQAQVANARASQLQQALNKQREDFEKFVEEKNVNPAPPSTGLNSSVSGGTTATVSSSSSNIEDLYENVYYIKMNNIEVYNPDNQQVATFNTESIVGGTGFLLSDGRFVTARRVVEPWYYYRNVRLGTTGRRNDIVWTFEDIQVCKAFNYKVVANFTAYSSSGANFQFRSTDMRVSSLDLGSAVAVVYEPDDADDTAMGDLFDIEEFKIYWYNDNYANDWATMMKRDQLALSKGITTDKAFSISPKANTEVSILGYPMKNGYRDSQGVRPRKDLNNINVSGLNDKNVIELSSRRWQNGNDGAPVFIETNAGWVCIGILSHTDAADRDVVTPISYIN